MGLIILLAAAWVMVLTRLVLDLAGIWRGRSKAWRWAGSGLLIGNGVTLVNSWADARNWPYPRTPLHAFTFPVLLAGLVLLVIGLRIQTREPRRPRRGRRSGQ